METTRDESIVQFLVDIADILVRRLRRRGAAQKAESERRVDLLGVSAAGVMLASRPDELRLVASSSDTTRCRTGSSCRPTRGAASMPFAPANQCDTRPSVWIRALAQFGGGGSCAGFRSLSAAPLRLRDTDRGALNLFSVEEVPIDQQRCPRGTRSLIWRLSVSFTRSGDRSERVGYEQLSGAFASRIPIEQAEGGNRRASRDRDSPGFPRLRIYAEPLPPSGRGRRTRIDGRLD